MRKIILQGILLAMLINTICLARYENIPREIHIKVNFNEENDVVYYYFDNFQYFRSQAMPQKLRNYKKKIIQEFSIKVINPICINFVNGNYRSMLYTKPGDTLEVSLSSNAPPKILLNGIYYREQLFINELISNGLDIVNQDLAFIKLDNKVKARYLLEELDELYSKRFVLLNKFADSLKYSNEYVNYLISDFKLLNLYTTIDIFYNLPDSNRPIDDFIPRIDSLSKELFFNESIITCNWYFEALYKYYYYKRKTSEWINNHLEDKKNIYYDTKKLLPLREAELIQNFLIRWDCECFGKENVENWIKDFRESCTQPQLLQGLEEHLYKKNRDKHLLTSNTKFQEQILESIDGKKITWDKLLNSSKTIKYIDIWASWCAPCHMEMPHSIALRKKIPKDKVSFIYVSVDEDKQKWLSAIKSDKINMVGTKHYLLDPKSELAIYLQSGAIPRYVLIDENSVVLNNNAPRPSSPETLDLLINAAK